jgi:hypothetical protein
MSEADMGGAWRSAALRALDWVRAEYPDAQVRVTLIPSDDALIAVRVKIETIDGPGGAAHGVAPGIEEAEDRAIIRAAEALGYRPAPTTPPQEDAEEEPLPPPLATVQHTQSAPLAGRSGHLGPPVVVRPRAQGSVQALAPTPAPVRSAPQIDSLPDEPLDDREPEMEDVSWTAFWKWARSAGYDTGDAVAKAIGRPIQGLTPREVRDLLRQRM